MDILRRLTRKNWLTIAARAVIPVIASITLTGLAGCGGAPPPATPSPKASPTPAPSPTPTPPAKYSLNLAVNPSGSGSVSPNSGSYDGGFQTTLQATPAGTCWVFDHWGGDVTGNTNPMPITINGNKSITAFFTKVKYALTVTVNPANTGSVGPAGGSYDCDTPVTLTAQPASGYQFDRWEGDASGNSLSTNIIMSSNKKVNAYFKTLYQTLKRDMPAGSTTATSISYTAQLRAGERIQGFAELTGEHQSGDSFYSWNLKIIGPGGANLLDRQGNVLSTQHFDIDVTVPLSGTHTITITHNSRWPKTLTVQIQPGGWQAG